MFLFLGHKACGILALNLGLNLHPPALEGKILIAFQESPRDTILKRDKK